MIRTLLGVLAGFAALSVLVLLAHAGLGLLVPAWFPRDGAVPTKAYVLDLAIAGLAALAGGAVAARIAKRAPVALAAVIVALGALPSGGPAWFRVALPVTGALFVLAGGWLRSE